MKILKKFALFAVPAFLFFVPAQRASATGIDASAIIGAIEAFQSSQIYQDLQMIAEKVKAYKLDMQKYMELVEQGKTQAKQLQQLYQDARTFAEGDLPHFMSDLKGNPIGTLNAYSNKLMQMARDANKAYDAIKNQNIQLNGKTYSLADIAGLKADKWAEENIYDCFSDGKLDEEAEAWAAGLSNKEKAYIRQKFNMSPENYRKWSTKVKGFKQSVSQALATCHQSLADAQKHSTALSGYATELAKMGVRTDVSAAEIGQMTNQLLLSIAETLQPALMGLQQAQAASLQHYAVAEQGGSGSGSGNGSGAGNSNGGQAGTDKSYEEYLAWKEEMSREEAEFDDDLGIEIYPRAPSNRSELDYGYFKFQKFSFQD